ncbi:hypothetical protein BDC45DRAFT_532535 [Circinella umbellata]|nr:hypothetical protein BDC45DRAFT_532535 [Circinella umbellata]
MIEIGNITVPSVISNLKKYLIDLDIIFDILSIYEQRWTIYCSNSFLHSVIIVMSKRPFIQNQYFQDTPLAQWSFDSYLDYTNKRQSRKSKNIALLNNFHNQLINMKQKKNLANNLDRA